jgi:hypothetical protein
MQVGTCILMVAISISDPDATYHFELVGTKFARIVVGYKYIIVLCSIHLYVRIFIRHGV